MKSAIKPGARTLASIRQLCCLGLPEELFIPRFLDAVRDWVACDTAHFVWADQDTLVPVNYSGDGFSELNALQRYFIHNSRVDYPGLVPTFAEQMRTFSAGSYGGDEPTREAYLRSDVYHEVLHPLGGRYMLYLVPHDMDGRPRGLLVLLRQLSGHAFTQDERRRLMQLEPYLRHGFSVRTSVRDALESLSAQGMAVLDKLGQMRYQDASARRLLWMASHEQIDSQVLIHLDPHGETPLLKRLHRRLVHLFHGHDAPPPSFELRNRWGRFAFRGSWLHGPEEGVVGVTIAHYIPRTLKAWQGLHRLGLAPRQQEVALLFSEGRTLAEISEELYISRNTVADYMDVIYKRLGITPGRESLQGLLLG
ncbi:MAG: helix-turn-helix transcriptional regulator [Polaromonas sp.]|nr:helix-turn-helix transcriptional regulator [Polaromonas sp.]